MDTRVVDRRRRKGYDSYRMKVQQVRAKAIRRRLLLALPPWSVLLLRNKEACCARALDDVCSESLVQRQGPRGLYRFQVPEDWARQKVRGVEQLWSSPNDGDAMGSNLNITSIVVARGTERESAMRILENVTSKGSSSGKEPKRIPFDGGEVLVLEIEPGPAMSERSSENNEGAWSLSPGPGLRIKTDDAEQKKDAEDSKLIISVAIPEPGSGRIYLQTIQILSGSLEIACAERMAHGFMQ